MELILNKMPKNVTVITGFPGFGLVGTITTEFLTNHLKCEEIGQIIIKDSSPVVAIHTEKLIKPITLFYSKEHNLIIVHSISPGTKVEWKISQAINDLVKKTSAKQIISVEGVMSQLNPTESVFFFANKENLAKKLEQSGLVKMKEGIVIGVTAALLTKDFSPSFVSMFAETHTDMPDSRAAAKVIKALDAYLGLKVDFVPLIKQAELFEAKIKHVLEQGQVATEAQQKKQQENYFG
jgi:uncharacterized protein